jgi:hypothetical protein
MEHRPILYVIAILAISMILVPTINSSAVQNAMGQSQPSTNQTDQGNKENQTKELDCKAFTSQISKNAVPINNPNKDVCDLVIPRTDPTIIGPNGTVLNKFLVINSIIEAMPAPANLTSMGGDNNSNNATSPMVVVMGEFALLQTELKPALISLAKSNANVTAVHNHPILEKPPMIFVHWNMMGKLDKVTFQVKNLVGNYEQIQAQSGKSQSKGDNSTGNPLDQIGKSLGGALGLGK